MVTLVGVLLGDLDRADEVFEDPDLLDEVFLVILVGVR